MILVEQQPCADRLDFRLGAVNRTDRQSLNCSRIRCYVELQGQRCPPLELPMINLYSRDLARAAAFYSELGFVEAFRTGYDGG